MSSAPIGVRRFKLPIFLPTSEYDLAQGKGDPYFQVCVAALLGQGIQITGFAEGDRVILRYKDKRSWLTPPLRSGETICNQLGIFEHAQILGEQDSATIVSNKGHELLIQSPTLAEHIELFPRHVTPIYHADANFITSKLDINVDTSWYKDHGYRFEILEAGTGHGGLTLHLARAIHSANIVPSCEDRGASNGDSSPQAFSQAISDTQKFRPATIHTVDISFRNTERARLVAQTFRRGMYLDDIEFYSEDVSCWISRQLRLRQTQDKSDPFLSHIVFDMPDPTKHLHSAVSALRPGGSLLIFNPSVSQISDAAYFIMTEQLPLYQDSILEVGLGMTGGRAWRIDFVKPRANSNSYNRYAANTEIASDAMSIADSALHQEDDIQQSMKVNGSDAPDLRTVCRPQVGGRIVGGGFLGIWRKKKRQPFRAGLST